MAVFHGNIFNIYYVRSISDADYGTHANSTQGALATSIGFHPPLRPAEQPEPVEARRGTVGEAAAADAICGWS